MSSWTSVDPVEYRRLPLRAHRILHDVPLHDVWRVELPGGGRDRTMIDVFDVHRAAAGRVSWLVKSLFAMRRIVGTALNWDTAAESDDVESFLGRVPGSERSQSLLAPGVQEGPFTILYVHRGEAMGEVRNRTAHAALVWSLSPVESGYHLVWAIYVRSVGKLTPLYMRAIDPFRRRIVYPSLLRSIRREWERTYRSPSDRLPT